jgi:DNA polymerase (family 10)
MHNYSNAEIADTLELTAQLLELHNENPFKIRALNNASYKINRHPVSLISLSLQELEKIEGIGKGIALKIFELYNTGTTQELNDILKKTPEGLTEIFKVKGLGPKKIAKLWNDLGIESIGELMYACKENRLIDIKGFGEKTQNAIIESIQFILNSKNWFHFSDAEILAQNLKEELNKKYSFNKIKVCGQIIRKCETVNEITIVCSPEINQQDIPKNYNGLKVNLISCKESDFNYNCFINSASDKHLEQLETLAPGIIKDINSDIEIYNKLKLQYILPELREGLNEINLAKDNLIPELITFQDLKGILHNHTTYSDGKHSLKEMAEYGKELGFEYLAICDHSISASYAGGLKPEEIIKQHQEIDALNKEMAPFKIFKGIECDIKIDGSLDYTTDILETFDIIVASIHQSFKMDEETATKRLIKAIENPYTTILGHMTGRLLLSRKGYPVNFKKIIDACADNQVIIELNAHPYRLDIDWRWIPYCIEKGVLISINPDAHSKSGYHDMQYGVNVARKGYLRNKDCFNALNLNQLEEWLRQKRK